MYECGYMESTRMKYGVITSWGEVWRYNDNLVAAASMSSSFLLSVQQARLQRVRLDESLAKPCFEDYYMVAWWHGDFEIGYLLLVE